MRVCDRCKRELNNFEMAKSELRINGFIYELCHACKKSVTAIIATYIEQGVKDEKREKD